MNLNKPRLSIVVHKSLSTFYCFSLFLFVTKRQLCVLLDFAHVARFELFESHGALVFFHQIVVICFDGRRVVSWMSPFGSRFLSIGVGEPGFHKEFVDWLAALGVFVECLESVTLLAAFHFSRSLFLVLRFAVGQELGCARNFRLIHFDLQQNPVNPTILMYRLRVGLDLARRWQTAARARCILEMAASATFAVWVGPLGRACRFLAVSLVRL